MERKMEFICYKKKDLRIIGLQNYYLIILFIFFDDERNLIHKLLLSSSVLYLKFSN